MRVTKLADGIFLIREPKRGEGADHHLVDVAVAEVGNPTVTSHETAGLADIGHGSVKGEGEVGLDGGVVVEVGDGLVSKGHGVAVSSVEVSASELGDPEATAREGGDEALNVVVEVVVVGTIPMQGEGIWLYGESSIDPLLHPWDTVRGGSGRGRDEVVAPLLEGGNELVPQTNTTCGVHLGLIMLVDFVHGQNEAIVGAGIVEDLRSEVTDRLVAPEHGDELEAAGEGGVGSPSGPVVVPASLSGDGIGDIVGGHARSPSETDLASGAGRGRGGRRGTAVAVRAAVVIVVAAVIVVIVGTAISSSSRRSILRVVCRGAWRDWDLGNAALPVLVSSTLALQNSVMVGRVSNTTGSESVSTLSNEGVGGNGRVEENAESDGGRGDEDVDERHSDRVK